MKNWGHIWPLRCTKSEKPQPKTKLDEEDRISKLPDDILHHILSSLDTTNQAVQTSLLSTRWLHLVRTLPNLTFHFESLLQTTTFPSNHNPELMSRFSRSVTRFLSLRDHTSAIDNFTLTSHDRSTDPALVAKCIDYAVSHGVRHLDIDANCHPIPTTTYASEVSRLFASETLRSLKLKQYTNSIVVRPKKTPLAMPNLKTLHLDSFGFRDDANDLYRFPAEPFSSSGLPKLEELTIRDCEVSGLVIRSSTLRVLEISFSLPLYSREARMEGISAPALRSFKYEGYVSLVCGEMEEMACLEEVYFDVYAVLASPYTDDVRDKMAVNLVRMMQQLGRNAKLVTLTLNTIQVLAMDGELLEQSPCPFPDMKCLKLRERRYGGLYPRMEGVGKTVMQYLTRGCLGLVVEFPNGGRIYSQVPGIREFVFQ